MVIARIFEKNENLLSDCNYILRDFYTIIKKK